MNFRRTNVFLIALVTGSVLVAVYETLAYWRDVEPASQVAAAWPALFLLLVVLWVVEDSRSFPEIQKPFEYGFLVFIFAIPYFPYYLWRTRRWRGLLLLAGFVTLYFLSHLAQLTIYALAFVLER